MVIAAKNGGFQDEVQTISAIPQNWASARTFDDIDAQAEQLRDYGQHYEQLGHGKFEGRFSSYFLGDEVGIFFESTNRVVEQHGRTPDNRISACLLAPVSATFTLDGASLSRHELVIWPPGFCFDAVTCPGMIVWVIDIDARTMPRDTERGSAAIRVSDPARVDAFRGLVTEVIQETTLCNAALASPTARHAIAGAFVSLMSGDAAPPTRRLVRRESERSLVRRARDIIHRDLGGSLTVPSIACELGVTRRAIEIAFAKHFDTSPSAYIRALRLNAVRRALATEQCMNLSIGDIAARWGIWHWSRFASTYSALFGELPSETRRRAQGF